MQLSAASCRAHARPVDGSRSSSRRAAGSSSGSTGSSRMPRRCAPLVVRASENNGAAAGLAEGARVRVKASVKVFHAPKRASGLDLQGMEGTVMSNVCEYKGQTLSANLPWRVTFELPPAEEGAKAAKFICHLEEDELELVS